MRAIRYWVLGLLGIGAAVFIMTLAVQAEQARPEVVRVTGANGRPLNLPVTAVQGVGRVKATDVARALGATIRYDPSARQMVFTLTDRTVAVSIGSVRFAVRRAGAEPVLGRLASVPVRVRGGSWFDARSVLGFLRQVRQARLNPAVGGNVGVAAGSPSPPVSERVADGETADRVVTPVGEDAGDAVGDAAEQSPERSSQTRPSRDVASFIRNIVIDAGHGDHDAGAIGPGGTREKNVNLGVALKLERLLKASLSARITMTRRDDTFLSLRERVGVARRVKADLFIAIHANSSAARNRNLLSGTEVYFFSSPSDNDARLAERMEGGPFDPQAEGIDPVLWDLMLAGNVVESHRLAGTIMRAMPGHTGLVARGVKSARFYVMYYSVMSNVPAILIELGFMSNPQEEAKLNDAVWQQKAAEGIAAGVQVYLDDLERRYPGGRGWTR